jgi:hypothetical protein
LLVDDKAAFLEVGARMAAAVNVAAAVLVVAPVHRERAVVGHRAVNL